MIDQATRKIEQLIAPAVEAAGYDLVRVQILKVKDQTLQVMAERADRRPFTVDDCAGISRLISPLLDVEDPVAGPYVLEVSSPGIDRPLVRLDDYTRFAGFEAKIEMARPVDGRRRLRGRIKGVEGDMVMVDCGVSGEDAPAEIPFNDIHRAMLVLTDDLIAAVLREQQTET